MIKKFLAKEMFETGLVITLIFLGFTYFQYIDYWQEAAMDFASEQGVLPTNSTVINAIEANPVYQTLTSVFVQYIFLSGILIALLGLFLMSRVYKRKGEYYKDVGKTLSLAPIIGLLIFYVIKVVTHYYYFNTLELGIFGGEFGILFDMNTYLNPQIIMTIILILVGIFIYKKGKRMERRH